MGIVRENGKPDATATLPRGAAWLTDQVDLLRLAINGTIEPTTRAEYAQFMTPAPIGAFMASMFRIRRSSIRLLDPGAAVGSLTAAFVASVLSRPTPPSEIHITAFEVDGFLAGHLSKTLSFCREACQEAGIDFSGDIREEDYIAAAAKEASGRLFEAGSGQYDCVIMNPPYRKIRSDSEMRHDLRAMGIETSNLYTAFMAVAASQLTDGGEMVSITPRSFCNGPYFRPFRRFFMNLMAIQQVHVFESRKAAFQEDQVLQENVIVHAKRTSRKPDRVALSVSTGPEDRPKVRRVPYCQVVSPDDPNCFIHLVVDDKGSEAAERMSRLPASLADLGLSVSTGRVVDFRARNHLRPQAGPGTAPLIYPAHFHDGTVRWPNGVTRKPNAILMDSQTDDLLVPAGVYVLVRRFSAKEERRRIVAAVYDPDGISDGPVGFENHLNYFHRGGRGLPADLARGLCVFLNSTLADTYFRQFSGHTQVNALDLQSLRYPSQGQLRDLAARVPHITDDQDAVDAAVEESLFAE
ncbi:MAG TPA: SAM-dependent methyltransferase [Phycisphaerales bacterium]|nr:SAM-dependent methyltransferase [Phycisphaerales bacterium]